MCLCHKNLCTSNILEHILWVCKNVANEIKRQSLKFFLLYLNSVLRQMSLEFTSIYGRYVTVHTHISALFLGQSTCQVQACHVCRYLSLSSLLAVHSGNMLNGGGSKTQHKGRVKLKTDMFREFRFVGKGLEISSCILYRKKWAATHGFELSQLIKILWSWFQQHLTLKSNPLVDLK